MIFKMILVQFMQFKTESSRVTSTPLRRTYEWGASHLLDSPPGVTLAFTGQFTFCLHSPKFISVSIETEPRIRITNLVSLHWDTRGLFIFIFLHLIDCKLIYTLIYRGIQTPANLFKYRFGAWILISMTWFQKSNPLKSSMYFTT